MSAETAVLAPDAAASSAAVATIDLRSDTVTKPSPKMRAAMAAAEVGDDVYGEDPTINRLEARAAEIFGREAALFVPSGTMGNQTAIRLHTQHGHEVICEARSHIVEWEMAMASAFSGCQLRTIAAHRGMLTWSEMEPHITGKHYHRASTGLICLENTHNMAGGTVTPLEGMEEVWAGAKERGLPVHLDGARVFNASVALGIGVRELTRGFSTVMFCLSKGLGAPVGSVLVGSWEAMDRARNIRKALGGGMRQAGILAAAGLIALEEGPKRLHEDHANARLLAESLARLPQVEIDLESVRTNIVIFTLRNKGNAAELVGKLKARGILAGSVGRHGVRFVTHLDVNRAACEEAARIATELVAAS
ncbi:MAG TPA: GntG family PLP-dependent aldolase [Acidobacteriaceae bacterium]|jgi:threonine aldolase|nr:GntG family PLP-dependent aldolase [Acidobacteriaceae bacterium]